MNIQAKIVRDNGVLKQDLVIVRPEATLWDYADAVYQLSCRKDYVRPRTGCYTCYGCSTCCNDNIILSPVDVKTIIRSPYFRLRFGKQVSWRDFWPHFTYIRYHRDKPLIELRKKGLRSDEYCIFFDEERATCRIHGYHPLICRIFVCLPPTDFFRMVRHAVLKAFVASTRTYLYRSFAAGIYSIGDFLVVGRPGFLSKLEDFQTDSSRIVDLLLKAASYREIMMSDVITLPPTIMRVS
ncbi:MAG: YkgJ family cysteine cluster protein [Peptococcaceae bacterium]|nr:YkgJ family cysteine cluster protein [Peptococcaceae bacterium]